MQFEVRDPLKLLNLNPLGVYFILDNEEYDLYANKLLLLNDIKEFKLKPFEIHVIKKENLNPQEITSDWLTGLRYGNVMVRLIESTDDCYTYGCEKILLKRGWHQSLVKLENFIQKVKRIDIRNARFLREQYLAEGYVNDQRVYDIDRILQVLSPLGFNRHIYSREFRPARRERSAPLYNDMNQSFGLSRESTKKTPRIHRESNIDRLKRIEDLLEKNYSDKHPEIKDNDNLIHIFDEIFNTFLSDPKFAEDILSSLYDKSKLDQSQNQKVKENQIVYEFERKANAGKKIKMKYGLNLIDCERNHWVMLNSINRLMFLACCIIAAKKNKGIKRNEIFKDRISFDHQYGTEWLMQLFKILKGDGVVYDHDFDNYFRDIEYNSRQGLRTAIRDAKTYIKEGLTSLCGSEQYFEPIKSYNSNSGRIDYFDIQPEKIKLSKTITRFADTIPEKFLADKPHSQTISE